MIVLFLWIVLSFCYSLKSKLQVKLADPDIVSNPSEYQKVAQSVSELDEVVHVCWFLCFLIGKHVISIEIILFYKTPYLPLELAGCIDIQEI